MQVRPRRPVVAALAGIVLALAGCSGGSSSGSSVSPTPEAPSSSAAPSSAAPSAASSASSSASSSSSASASPSPALATLPPTQCLTGTWRLVRFVGASQQTYGTGEGGDVTVRFSDGGYTLLGAGKEPATVTLAGQTADLYVDGRATGTYRLRGDTATFRQTKATGSGLFALGRRQQQLTMSQVTRVVGLQGDAMVACTAQAMTVTLSSVRLELARA